MGGLHLRKQISYHTIYISSEIVTDAENKPMVTRGERVTKWEIGIDTYILPVYKTDDK